MAGCTAPMKGTTVRLRHDLRDVPTVTECRSPRLLVAEADKPFLDSLRKPCDWGDSASSRAVLMIRFLWEKA